MPGLTHGAIEARLPAELCEEAEFERLVDLEPVWTDPDQPWMAAVRETAAAVTGTRSRPDHAVPYFTDASILTPAMGHPPTMILGPGEPGQAHRTDEYCETAMIEAATEIYRRLIESWAGRS